MPKAVSRVYRSPIASNKSAEICWYIENRKNLDQPVVRVAAHNSIPAASGFPTLASLDAIAKKIIQ